MLKLKQKLNINSKNFLTVLKIIRSQNKEARLIGGVVRDSIIGLKSHDIDIATSMLPEEVSICFADLGYRVIPTGIKFGTVTLLFKDESFEITTLRKDLTCDGRHPKIEFTNDFYLDSLRRDFTMNALSYCPFEEIIYDYFNGISDLKNGIVRFIGNPDERIVEDYLRILRYFRFLGRFGKKIDQNSLSACLKHKSDLKKLSLERIKSEFDQILKLSNFAEILKLMKPVLLEILPASNIEFDNYNIQNTQLSQNLKYALLFKNSDVREKELIKLKFSRLEARNICDLLSVKNQELTGYLLKKIWLEKNNFYEYYEFFKLMGLVTPSLTKLFLELQNKEKPKFPVNGHDLKSINIKGPNIKNALIILKEKWIESNFKLTTKELIRLL